MKKTIFPLLLSTLYFLLSTSTAFSQSIGFSIYPPILETTIKPGKIISQVFTIQNLSESDKIVTARLVPFVPEGQTGTALLQPNLKPNWLNYFSLVNSFISLGQPFNLSARKSEQLILSINIPLNAREADYYASLILTTNPETNSLTQPTNSQISTTIGANILLTVNTKINPPTIVRLKDFAPSSKDFLFQYGQVYFMDNLTPIHFRANAQNEGRYLTKTHGLVRVSKGDRAVSLQSLIPLNLLANSTRELLGSPSGEIIFTPKITDFGTHKIELDLRSDNSSSHSELILVLLPAKISLAVSLGMILLFTIIKITRKVNLDKTMRGGDK